MGIKNSILAREVDDLRRHIILNEDIAIKCKRENGEWHEQYWKGKIGAFREVRAYIDSEFGNRLEPILNAIASEVAAEIFEEIEKIIKANTTGFYSPHGNYMGQGVSLGLFTNPIAELKNKYAGSEKDNG